MINQPSSLLLSFQKKEITNKKLKIIDIFQSQQKAIQIFRLL